jgi:hypothetical protein
VCDRGADGVVLDELREREIEAVSLRERERGVGIEDEQRDVLVPLV